MGRGLHSLVCAVVLLGIASPAAAEVQRERVGAGGYFRIMTRPDFQGGDSRLGFWNLYGRLLNEGPWGALELRLDLLPRVPGRNDVWTSIHTKIEGGSFLNADAGRGLLDRFAVTQMYVQAGNVLADKITWQLGTLDTYFGDLGLYDLKPAQVFYDTVGLSGRYREGPWDVVVGGGDAGYFLRGNRYSTIFTGGGTARLQLGSHLALGAGGQYYYEPKVGGNRFAPHQTPLPDGIGYEQYYRGEIVQTWLDRFPGQEQNFPRPRPTDASSFKLVAYFGFGKLGPLKWSNLFANWGRRHPDSFITETFAGRSYDIYVKAFTDERYFATVGNEMQVVLVPEVLDLAWAVLWGKDDDRDNIIAADESNRTYYSTVARLQYYATSTVHLLLESSVAEERSDNGNLWREHFDSIFQSQGGVTNDRGLEFGDTNQRSTWQLKTGIVLNPVGFGIYTRPSIRILYGLQYSNVHSAYRTNQVQSLDEYDYFRETRDRHWHSLVALEAEGWF